MAKTTPAPEGIADLDMYADLQTRQNEGIDVPIKGPDGSLLGFSIRVAGPDSALAQQAEEDIVNERISREDGSSMNASALAEARLKGLAKVTLGWGEFKRGGAIYSFSYENALKLYRDMPFIRDQINVRAGSRAAFMRPSAEG
jgi:hypothetical protein